MTTNSYARPSGRAHDELRQVRITRNFTIHAEGSVLVEFGNTKVLCTASVDEKVPPFRRGSGEGWVTAEYGMLPRSTHTRSDREAAKGKQSGRTQEIQRLIGRALRAVFDLEALGERTIVLDCDVLQADGGTRTAAITGAFVAAQDAVDVVHAELHMRQLALAQYAAHVLRGLHRSRLHESPLGPGGFCRHSPRQALAQNRAACHKSFTEAVVSGFDRR